MKRPLRKLRWFAIAAWAPLVLFAAAPVVRAQDDRDAKPQAEATPTLPSRADDPIVQALLASNPTTPAELVKAAGTLLELGAPDEAHALVKQLAAEKLDDPALAALAAQFGTTPFLQFALIAELQPEGRQIADAVLAVADRQARDPARLAKLIGQLKDPNPALRRGVIVRLRSGRDSAIQALVAVLADEGRADEHAAVRQALAGFGADAVGPLLALVRSAKPALAVQAIQTLEDLGQADLAIRLLGPAWRETSDPQIRSAAREALATLFGRVPDSIEAVTLLARFARSYYDDRRKLHADMEGQTVVWNWDAEKAALASERVSARLAALDLARDLAEAAAELAPRNRGVRLLYLGALAEAAAYRTGVGAALAAGPDTAQEILADQDLRDIEALLTESLASEHTAAATVAVQVLGQSGKAELLYRRSPQPSALIEVVRHPDRRLRMAALAAVFALKPSKPYPGSSFVVEALGYFAGSFGAAKALAADARPLEVELQAGALAATGYETEVATTDREALAQAVASPDMELALIDFNLASPVSGQLLERLRRDNRTARLPIGIVASSEDLDEAARLARRVPLTAVVIRTQDPGALKFQIDQLFEKLGRSAISEEERRQQASQAIAWLSEMTAAPGGLYNLRRTEAPLADALWDPQFGPQAARILATLGTPRSQKALVDLASFAAQPLELREAASAAFAASVADYGPLLTTGEISLQYDRYNQSETQDQATQKVLASILDVVEARAVADQAD
ncbi:MAG TPA: hypothetical protein VMV10_30630 [Pirellulales bacterium]|nr:hypothetical protein [Pirellulales bacterium]